MRLASFPVLREAAAPQRVGTFGFRCVVDAAAGDNSQMLSVGNDPRTNPAAVRNPPLLCVFICFSRIVDLAFGVARQGRSSDGAAALEDASSRQHCAHGQATAAKL